MASTLITNIAELVTNDPEREGHVAEDGGMIGGEGEHVRGLRLPAVIRVEAHDRPVAGEEEGDAALRAGLLQRGERGAARGGLRARDGRTPRRVVQHDLDRPGVIGVVEVRRNDASSTAGCRPDGIAAGPFSMKSTQPDSVEATCLISPPRVSSLAVGDSRACSSVRPSTVCRRKKRCARRVSRMSARSPVALPLDRAA